jgi:hypothetical protein
VHTSWSIPREPGPCLQSMEGSSKNIFAKHLPLPLLFFCFLIMGNPRSARSMVHSYMHGMYIYFPHFKTDHVQQKKKAFPQHTMLVIEDLATLGLVGGWHYVSSCKLSGSHTHTARHVPSVCFRSQWRRLLGHFIVLRLRAPCFPACHSLTEAHAPGKTLGERS